MRCGNSLDHWFFKQSNVIYGGVPPTLEDIITEPNLVIFLLICCFFKRTQLTHTKKLSVLAATVLIFHDAFLGIIGNEPSDKYTDSNHHHFHHKIIFVLVKTQISIETFRKWKNEVIAGFNGKNWLVVDVSKVGQGSAKSYVNSRCFVRVIDEKGEAIGILHQTIQNDTKHINIMSVTMGFMGKDLHNTIK